LASDAHDLDPRVRLLLRILSELETSGLEFALLHGDDDAPPDVTSDVDMAFAVPPPLAIEPILQRLCRAGEATIVQRLHYDIPHAYYYILRLPGAPLRFLHLDCLCDPIGVNRYRLPTRYLLEGAAAGAYGRRIARDREAIYLLMKRVVKGRVSQSSLAVLRDRFRDAPEHLWLDVRYWFGRTPRKDVELLLSAQDPDEARAPLQALAAMAARRARWRHPLRSAGSHVVQAVRKCQRFLQPTGLFVVVVGPDGSGKSTVATAVLGQLERAFRRTWRFHWRPGLLPRLGRHARQPDAAAASPPDEASKYRGLVSLARFIYYWLDFILGYWLVIYPRRAQTTLVLAERYFPDVVVNPQRYGFSVPSWMLRVAAAMVPSPDLVVILKGDPQAIFSRKGELSPAKIAAQLRLYEEEVHHWRRSEAIDTQPGAAAVTARLADLIVEECAGRTSRRLEGDGSIPPWRAFPSARGVKVWFHDAESQRSWLDLYHAYSPLGRLAKTFARETPRALHRMLFRDRPDVSTAARFARLTQIIRTQLADDTLEASFSAGTPGPHRKLTAQVTRAGRIVCYVKIAQDDSVRRLLEREADMLGWLPRGSLGGAGLPEVLALVRDEAFTLLFLSSPQQPVRQRLRAPDAQDAEFLAGLAAVDAGTAALAQAFDQKGFDAYLQQGLVADSAMAAILRQAIDTLHDRFALDGVSATPCHGDYAPWNTLQLTDSGLFVIDWEYGQRRAPALTDLFHRVFMPSLYVLGLSPFAAVDELLKLGLRPMFRPVIERSNVAAQDLPAYVLLYLLGQLVGGRHGRHEDGMLVQMIAYALQATRGVPARKKILVVAYACQPGHGSEPGVGWRMCEAISREHEAWVITRENNRADIERGLAEQPNANLHFTYTDLPPWARRWKKAGRGIRLYYYLWQFAALRVARRLSREVPFDLAHHVTFVNDYFFTSLALQRIPYVWGPIGSPGKRPAALWETRWKLMLERREYYMKVLLRALDPLYWLSAVRAKLVIGVNDDVGRTFPLRLLARDKYLSHTAIGVEEALMARPSRERSGFEVLSVGRLIRIKNFDLTIRAFALLARREPSARLTIVGDGPMQESLEQLAEELRIRDRVHFAGHVPREAAMEAMGRADVFVFPSCEAEGMVTLEAMAQGLPVVCMNYGGPAKMITPQCGFAVEVGAGATQALADALIVLAQDRDRLEAMSAAARLRVQERFLWERRPLTIRQWYRAAGLEQTHLPAQPGFEQS
jgi:glycosyltransferase involved in cell wall biosynthesis/thymidylate kinase